VSPALEGFPTPPWARGLPADVAVRVRATAHLRRRRTVALVLAVRTAEGTARPRAGEDEPR
jgi:hypothetical protein